MLLSGCFASNSSSSSGTYMSGKDGITVSFLANNPPSTIYYSGTSDTTPIEIEALNKGTSESSSVKAFFTGFDKSIIELSEDLSGIDFSGDESHRTRYNPEGGYDAVSADMSVSDMQNADTYEFNLKLVYCYDYETSVAIPICVDPEPNKNTREDACVPSSVSTNGQGAPVGVSGVEVTSMPDNVRLKITISHYGQGEVLKSGTECKGAPDREDEGIVDFVTPTLGQDIQGDCVNEDNEVKLRNGQASIVCNFDLSGVSSDSAFKTILNMELNGYQIKDSIQKSIKIINEQTT